MKTIAMTATALALLSYHAVAAENDISGNVMLPYCKGHLDHASKVGELTAYQQGYCFGLVQGISDMMGNSKYQSACADIPYGVTYGQKLRVVVRYMETHPQELHLSLPALTVTALREAWPCTP